MKENKPNEAIFTLWTSNTGLILSMENSSANPFGFDISISENLDEIIPIFFDVFPMKEESILLEKMAFQKFEGNISMEKIDEKIRIQFFQHPSEMLRWQHFIQEYNQKKLAYNMAQNNNPNIDMTNSLHLLGYLCFKHTNNKFQVQNLIPEWFQKLFPNYNYSSPHFDLAELFPYLEVFIPDLLNFYDDPKDGKLLSDIWVAYTSDNEEIILQATGIKNDGASLLFIENMAESNSNKQADIQKARVYALECRQLRKTEEALRKLLTYKEQFISIFSHDVKTPIAGAYSLIGLLEKDKDFMRCFSDEHRHIFKVIYKDLKYTHEYSQRLYDWSSLSFGNIALDKSTVVLKDVIQNILLNYSDKLTSKNLEISMEIGPEIEITIDEVFFRSALDNLLTNAIKFSNIGGKIEIKAHRNQDYTRLEIQDHGVGMSEKQLNFLFDNELLKSEIGTVGEKGTGLGMSIVKKIMEVHKAKIKVESELQKGTLISIDIPK